MKYCNSINNISIATKKRLLHLPDNKIFRRKGVTRLFNLNVIQKLHLAKKLKLVKGLKLLDFFFLIDKQVSENN